MYDLHFLYKLQQYNDLFIFLIDFRVEWSVTLSVFSQVSIKVFFGEAGVSSPTRIHIIHICSKICPLLPEEY